MNIATMIVEDDTVLSERLKLTLSHQGYVITGCPTNGRDAVELYQNKPADLVLMDIHLADGDLNGIETAHRLRQLPGEFRLIYITTDESGEIFEQAKHTHPQAFMDKPLHNMRLFRAIELALQADIQVTSPPMYIFLPQGQKHIKLIVADILYLQAEASQTWIYFHSQDDIRRVLVSISSNHVLNQLRSKALVKVHRSYCVNLEKVEYLENYRLHIGGQNIPISESHRADVMKKMTFLKRP